ncbi:MAG: hypothetical protein VR73_08455 [Gammaproteobacteria bacterium BRH_c0]|nr:MAG: hypothetical protein VR73_08455 [Gammaproteobacteria bacterium BRH_c0]
MKNLLIAVSLLLCSSAAWSWSATYLGGQNWAITCANGTSHSYTGSSAGLDIVGPALCPGGIVDPGPLTEPVWTVAKVKREIIAKEKPRADAKPSKAIDKASPKLME